METAIGELPAYKLTNKIDNKRLDKTLSDEILAFAYWLEEYRLQVFAQGQVKVRDKLLEKFFDNNGLFL